MTRRDALPIEPMVPRLRASRLRGASHPQEKKEKFEKKRKQRRKKKMNGKNKTDHHKLRVFKGQIFKLANLLIH